MCWPYFKWLVSSGLSTCTSPLFCSTLTSPSPPFTISKSSSRDQCLSKSRFSASMQARMRARRRNLNVMWQTALRFPKAENVLENNALEGPRKSGMKKAWRREGRSPGDLASSNRALSVGDLLQKGVGTTQAHGKQQLCVPDKCKEPQKKMKLRRTTCN